MSRRNVVERVEVPFSVVPFSRAWVAGVLALSGISLALGLGLTLVERARHHRARLVENTLGVVIEAPSSPRP